MIPTWLGITCWVGGIALGMFIEWTVRSKNPAAVRTDDEWNSLCVARQQEAYELGKLHGQVVGQQAAFAAVSDQVRDRNPYGEITFEDIERARKGILH